nr:MAG TPA: hypothetical protein [Caudoviricetes sp.]
MSRLPLLRNSQEMINNICEGIFSFAILTSFVLLAIMIIAQ